MSRSTVFNRKLGCWASKHTLSAREDPLPIKNVLILRKRSRYELEKLQRPGVSDAQLEKVLAKRGSDLVTLLRTHRRHNEFTAKLESHFKKAGFEVDVVDRTGYCREKIDCADLIAAAGGDGTYLIGASLITSRNKPLVGFNTDPSRSAGHLCFPSNIDYSQVIRTISKNEFTWKFCTRIEVKLTGSRAHENHVDLSYGPATASPGCADIQSIDNLSVSSRVLPFLALNEVFIGESLSSQVSSLDLDVPGLPTTSVKCSGLCVATGTGSTSWHLSINRISHAKVREILRLAGVEPSNEEVSRITNSFNESLKFPSNDPRLFYTLRDLIRSTISPVPPGLPAADYATSLGVRSRCSGANIVLDGACAWAFNDGTTASLCTKSDNELRTIDYSHLK